MERPRGKRLSWESRCEIVALIEAGMSPALAAAKGGASRATGYRLRARFRTGGWAALRDRPSTPPRQPRRLCSEAEQTILAVRRRSAYGPVRFGRPPATSAFDDRQGVAPARLLAPAAPRAGCGPLRSPLRTRPPGRALAHRHEEARPLLGAGQACARSTGRPPARQSRVGWQYLRVAIDDHSRLAYAELVAGQDADSCVRFLERAAAWYQTQGIIVERVLTDNAKAYHSRTWIEARRRLQIGRRYTRAYRPRTKGKAERFIQTLLREWAYTRGYPSSSHRARALSGYLRWYNRRRPHSSLQARPPISPVSHLCGHDS
jgi:transposase InsO family protein